MNINELRFHAAENEYKITAHKQIRAFPNPNPFRSDSSEGIWLHY